MATMAPAGTSRSAVESWVREHQVCWEVGPYFELRHHEKVQLGSTLTLVARLPRRGAFEPGGRASTGAYETLREIVAVVVPAGARVRFEPFDAAVHLRGETGWEPEVELCVEVLHHGAALEPLDAPERGQLALMVARLESLGVQAKSWDPRRAALTR
jgi:hypothetical protein